MRRRELREPLCDGELQTTAMIDVIFILLIFFVSVSRLKESRLELQLPDVEARAHESLRGDPLVIEIGADGRILFEGASLGSTAELAQALARASDGSLAAGERPVQVRGDRDARHGDIAAVLQALQKSGFYKLDIAVQ